MDGICLFCGVQIVDIWLIGSVWNSAGVCYILCDLELFQMPVLHDVVLYAIRVIGIHAKFWNFYIPRTVMLPFCYSLSL